MQPYRQSQVSFWILILVPLFLLLVLLPVDEKDRVAAITFGLIGPAALVLLFYGMSVSVDDEAVVIRFGVGLIKKRVLMKDIQACHPVKSTFWMGWGIRMIANGWLYNCWGYDAVELTFKNSSKVIWIGTPDSSTLKQAIDARIRG